jgi:hypothetical protein
VSAALGIQHAIDMCLIILPPAACPALQCFFHNSYLKYGTNFGKQLLNVKCFDFIYNFCPKRFSYYEELGDVLSHIPPEDIPTIGVVAGLVWSNDPESYAGSSVYYW